MIIRKNSLIGVAIAICFLSIFAIFNYSVVNADDSEKINPPDFNRESCFCNDDFFLELSTEQEGVDIYYTLDGTDPTTASQKYLEPIHVEDASVKENNISSIKDISPFFRTDLLKKYLKDDEDFAMPTQKVDKGTIVRAICVDSSGNISDVASETYFVGLNDDYEYQDIPVYSLTASEHELFDYDDGIYVLGRYFDEVYNKNKIQCLTDSARKWKGNYSIEKKISGETVYFSNIKSDAVREAVTLEIKGNASRSWPQKSFNVKGTDIFCCLYDSGNDVFYKMKDPAVANMVEGLKLDCSSFEPCQVFLNGEYWGLYYVEDRIFSKKYYKNKYGKIKNLTVIKAGELNEGEEADFADYQDMVNFAASNDMSIDSNYEYIKERVDIDSMIDYYCTELFIANKDWPAYEDHVKNIGCWRADVTGGKWKYILFDTNYTIVLSDYEKDMMEHVMDKKYRKNMFQNLYVNEEFRRQFMAQMLELMDTEFSYNNAKKDLDSVYASGRKYIQSYFDRYHEGKLSVSDYDSQYNTMLNFLRNRKQYMIEDIDGANKDNGFKERLLNTDNIKLSASLYEYDGKGHKPTVTIGSLKQGTDFTVTYSEDSVNVGSKQLVITGMGNYVGTATRTYAIVAAGDHQYGNLVKKKEAGCTKDGMQAHYYCSLCNTYFDENKIETSRDALLIPATGHTYDQEKTRSKYLKTAADCTHAAIYYKSCSCGESSEDKGKQEATFISGEAKGHIWDDGIITKQATCTEDGMKAHYYCSRCKTYFDENKTEKNKDTFVIPATGHTYNQEKAEEKYLKVAADCAHAATYYKSCSCGENSKGKGSQEATFTSGKPREHVWDNGKTTKQATCSNEGTKEYRCTFTDCNETKAEALPVKPNEHSYEVISNIAAGYMTDGHKLIRCKYCSKEIRESSPGFSTSYVKSFKVTKGSKSFTVKWKKQSKNTQKKFTGYRIRYSTNPDFSGAVTKYVKKSKNSLKVKKLGKKTTYYVEISSYVSNGNGTFYSAAKTKSVKTK